jgi:hypothetical protein
MPPPRKALVALVIISGLVMLTLLGLYISYVLIEGAVLAETFQGSFQGSAVAFTVLLGVLLASHPPHGVPPFI